MKALNMLMRLKRVQVVKWGRRIGCSTGGSAAVCFRRGVKMECHGGGGGGGGGSDFLRQLICRFKSQWKQALRRERSSTSSALYSYAYDIQSYSQNFDDGTNCLDEHLSPLAPR